MKDPEQELEQPGLVEAEPEPTDADLDAETNEALAAVYDSGMADDDGEAEASGKPPAEPPGADQDPPADEPITAKAPEHWSKEDKDFLASLPDDQARVRVQEWRKSIESGYDRKFGEIRAGYTEIDQALDLVDPEIQQYGITKGAAVKHLIDHHRAVTQDLGVGLAGIAKSYAGKITPEQAQYAVAQVAAALGATIGGTAPGQSQAANGKDPATIAREVVQQEIAQHRAREQETAAQGTLKAFTEARGEGGQAKHPHYEAVKPVMQGLLLAAAQSGQRMTLEQAYEQAVWTRPDLREALSEAQQKAAAKAAAERRRSKAAAVQGARTPRSRSIPVVDEAVEADTDALMSEVYDRHMAG